MTAVTPPTTVATKAASLITRYRWYIVMLLFFSTTINYVDRALFSNLIPYFEADLRLGPMDLAMINVAFLLAYGLGMTAVGRFVDRVGVRVGLAITFIVWNVASIGHAAVWSIGAFVVIRILLGLGEAGNFPAAIRTVAEWFPRRERALATGWFNCGSNIGAVATPLLVPIIADRWGWRACFVIIGGIGIVWIFFWLRAYRRPEEHPRVSPEELAYIKSDPVDPVEHVSVLTLLGQRQVYAYALGRFFTEAPWWFYLTWMPKFLSDTYGLSSTARAWSIAAIYLVADFGSVVGGWISSSLIRRGYTVNQARKIALLIAALSVVPIASVAWLQQPTIGGISVLWIVIPVVALAASAHQAWSANMFTVISDTLPRSAVGTTVGIGTAFGAVGSSAFQVLVAVWLMQTQNYHLPFLLAGTLYLVGLLALHLILPRLQPANITPATRPRVKWWQVATACTLIAVTLIALQSYLNRPPYTSVKDYLAKRSTTLSAQPQLGPAAKVGWQDAQWVRWTTPAGDTRWELIKLDRHGHPLVEPKGAAAKQYTGPAQADLPPVGP
jgi:ACS family hexuronate transporter-like MFS transporter